MPFLYTQVRGTAQLNVYRLSHVPCMHFPRRSTAVHSPHSATVIRISGRGRLITESQVRARAAERGETSKAV